LIDIPLNPKPHSTFLFLVDVKLKLTVELSKSLHIKASLYSFDMTFNCTKY